MSAKKVKSLRFASELIDEIELRSDATNKNFNMYVTDVIEEHLNTEKDKNNVTYFYLDTIIPMI